MLNDGRAGEVNESFGRHVLSRGCHDERLRRHLTCFVPAVERRQELAPGEIARRPEQSQQEGRHPG